MMKKNMGGSLGEGNSGVNIGNPVNTNPLWLTFEGLSVILMDTLGPVDRHKVGGGGDENACERVGR